MRRAAQLLSATDTEAVLRRGSHGVLACLGDDDYPYAVPVNYVVVGATIYVHSAPAGHKMDAIARNPKVSFAVVDEDTIMSAAYTSCFRSVIAFGRARIAEGEERLRAFNALVDKYSGDQPEEARRQKAAACDRACIIAIDIEHLTGKEAIEYARDHGQAPVAP
jgi:nitroimidazol reductase NimA-like FMN-containing flavoprotein (pyridoxamine 5'-phosphate oxidase superfamily)